MYSECVFCLALLPPIGAYSDILVAAFRWLSSSSVLHKPWHTREIRKDVDFGQGQMKYLVLSVSLSVPSMRILVPISHC